jgi:hypothetical protein
MERTTALLVATNQKNYYIDNRLNHCAIETLVGMMFAMLHFKSCYIQKPLSLLYVWDIKEEEYRILKVQKLK